MKDSSVKYDSALVSRIAGCLGSAWHDICIPYVQHPKGRSYMNILEDPNVPKQKCPRCFKDMPSIWFQPPVSICMVCYAGIPVNAGLSLLDLKAKAKKSRWGRYYKSKGEVVDTMRRFMNSPASERQLRDYDETHTKEDCSLCLKVFNEDELVRAIGNKSHPDCTVVCQPCADRIQMEDEQLLKDEAASVPKETQD